MKQLKRYIIIGIFFVLIAGSLAHFLYDWTGNNYVIGFFTPINESIWEHMKLLFFPMSIYSVFIIFKFNRICPCIISSLCFGILIGTLLIPIFFYAYTSLLGKDIFVLDIGTFVLSVIIAFRISYKLSLSCKSEPYKFLLYFLTAALFLCFIRFTYHAPDLEIFADPSINNQYRSR